MKSDDWRGLYREGWKGEIVAGAFAHPAKYARGLIRRIYEHAQSEGWARPGDGVVDPFGGVALGGLDAMRLGLHWTGVELEPRFAELGNANIALWNSRYQGRFAKWGTAHLLNGDSRNLSEILTGWQTLAISSPPYASSDQDYKGGWARFHAGHEPLWREDRQREAHYGSTPGQIAAMPAGSFELAVSSPPYEASAIRNDKDYSDRQLSEAKANGKTAARATWGHNKGSDGQMMYGESAGQLGGIAPADFWTAARAIVEQTYAVLAPGAHACWVVKDFVRDGQRVEFSDQWRQLCEAVGFTTLHLHRAWVVDRP